MKRMLMCLGLVVGIAGHLSAATYYVDVAGNDKNPGTITQPFATLWAAYHACTAGDTIYFRGGSYNWMTIWEYPCFMIDGQDQWQKSGTATAPITIAANPGETVQIFMGEQVKWTSNPSLYGGCWSANLNGTMVSKIIKAHYASKVDFWIRVARAGSGGGWHVTRTEGTVKAVSAAPAVAGSGYQVGDILGIVSNSQYPGGNSAQVRVASVRKGGVVTSVSLADGGVDGYHIGVCTTTPATGTGTGCQVRVTGATPSAAFTTGNVAIVGAKKCGNESGQPIRQVLLRLRDQQHLLQDQQRSQPQPGVASNQQPLLLHLRRPKPTREPAGVLCRHRRAALVLWIPADPPGTPDPTTINHVTVRNCWFKGFHCGVELYGSYHTYDSNLIDVTGGNLRYLYNPPSQGYSYDTDWQAHNTYFVSFNSVVTNNFFGRNGGDAGGSDDSTPPTGLTNNGCLWQNNVFYTSANQHGLIRGAGSLITTVKDQYLNNIFLSDLGTAVDLYGSCTGLTFKNNFVESGSASLYGGADPTSSVIIENNLFNTLNSQFAGIIYKGAFDHSSLSNNQWTGSTLFQHGSWTVNTVDLLNSHASGTAAGFGQGFVCTGNTHPVATFQFDYAGMDALLNAEASLTTLLTKCRNYVKGAMAQVAGPSVMPAPVKPGG